MKNKNTLPTDLTQGNIWHHIYRIATPVIWGQIFNSLYNWIDTYWGGKISSETLAAFSITFPIFLVSIAMGQCIAGGSMVLVSNAFGAKETDKAKHYLKQAVLLSIVIGAVMLIVILLLGKTLLSLLGAEGVVLQNGIDYLYVLAFGFPFLMIYFALNTGLIAQGNTKFMRNVLILNAGINFLLDPLFLYGFDIGGVTIIPAMGIKGIALATVLVQILGAVIAWYKIQSLESTRWIKGDSLKIERKTAGSILKYGLPSLLQIGLAAVGLGLVNFFLSKFTGADIPEFFRGGDHALAGYGIALRIEQLALVPTFGLGIALSALVGQNNGAKKIGRIRESYWKTIVGALGLWVFIMGPLALFGTYIIQIFTQDPKVIEVAHYYLFFAFFAFMGYQIVGSSSGVLSGMKHPYISIAILISRQTIMPLLFIPLFAYAMKRGIYGIFTSVVISVWIAGIILCIVANIIMRRTEKKLLKEIS